MATHQPRFAPPMGRLLLVAVALVVAGPPAAGAQPRPAPVQAPGPWSIEIYGGSLLSSSLPSGTPVGPLPTGTPFVTAGGFPSRTVASWYFGDGAALFNQTAAQFGSRFGLTVRPIAPLDEILTAAGARRTSGGAFGVRLRRRLSSRLSVELAAERGSRPLRLTDRAADVVENARASFETGFTSLVNTLPQVNLIVTSTAEVIEPPAGSTTVTAAIVLSILTRGAVEVRAVGGAGAVFGGGGALDVRLRGAYQFQIFNVFPISESDLVTISIADSDRTTVGVVGGGLTYALSSQAAVAVDARLFMGRSGLSTTVSASPSRSTVSPPVFLPSLTDPSIQFSNQTGVPSSLSGTPVRDLETFRADGLELRAQLTAGFVIRF